MRALFVVPLLVLIHGGCSSAPSSEASRRPAPGRRAPSSPPADNAAGTPEPAQNLDSEVAQIRAEFGCENGTPPQPRACRAIDEWQHATAALEPGVYPGFALTPAAAAPEIALLVIRERQGRRMATWSIVRPVSPAEAASISAVLADLLADRAPPSLAGTPLESGDPEAGSPWLALTAGTSARVSLDPPLVARRSGERTFVMGTAAGASATPLVAVHTRIP